MVDEVERTALKEMGEAVNHEIKVIFPLRNQKEQALEGSLWVTIGIFSVSEPHDLPGEKITQRHEREVPVCLWSCTSTCVLTAWPVFSRGGGGQLSLLTASLVLCLGQQLAGVSWVFLSLGTPPGARLPTLLASQFCWGSCIARATTRSPMAFGQMHLHPGDHGLAPRGWAACQPTMLTSIPGVLMQWRPQIVIQSSPEDGIVGYKPSDALTPSLNLIAFSQTPYFSAFSLACLAKILKSFLTPPSNFTCKY